MGDMTQESATSRLARLLTMVPWLMNHQGIDIEQAASTLGVTRKQIEADLQLLFVCGTPGHMPDDLIEAEWEQGHVFVRNADEISKPLRFTRDEALALTVGLRALLDVPGLSDTDAVQRALAKLSDAAGETSTERIHVSLADDTSTLATVRAALAQKKRLHLTYLVASRDEITQRDVDPMRLFTSEGHWYLEGWCHRSDGVRIFRVDRIETAESSDIDIDIPHGTQGKDLSQGFFSADADAPQVRLSLAPGAHWVAEYYPCHEVKTEGNSVYATFVLGDGRWLRRLMLSLGGDAQIISPTSARADIAERARAALAAYDGVNDGEHRVTA